MKVNKTIEILILSLFEVSLIIATIMFYSGIQTTEAQVNSASPGKIEIICPDYSQSYNYLSENIAKRYIDNGIKTREQLDALGVSGKVYEILDAHIKEQERLAEEKRRRDAAARLARVSRPASIPSTSTATGQWAGSHAEWDALAIQTLCGWCSESEVNMMMAIHHGEGGPNSINWNSPSKDADNMYGGWQLKYDIAIKEGIRWWDPVDSTTRAYRYVMGRYGSVEAAYNFKKSRGWY